MIDDRLKQYLEFTKTFEKNELDMVENKVKLRNVLIGVVSAVAFAQAIAMVVMLPLKEKVPVVFRVDRSTGAIEHVSFLDVDKFNNTQKDEVLDKANLANYVLNRENYDYNYIQALYDKTLLMGNASVNQEYVKLYDKNDKNSLYSKYGNNVKVKINITNISFYKTSATVRFTRTIIGGSGGGSNIVTQEMATIAYQYVNATMKDEDRLINPLGFQIQSYRLDKDLTATSNNGGSNGNGGSSNGEQQ
jgi:type IV secretion system protein VirB8